jgi:hypothetical protein
MRVQLENARSDIHLPRISYIEVGDLWQQVSRHNRMINSTSAIRSMTITVSYAFVSTKPIFRNLEIKTST